MPTYKYLLILDPGHGGADHGAIDGGMHEKVVNLHLADKVRIRAEQQGIGVVLTRTSDVYVSLKKRVMIERHALTTFAGRAAFVSLHVNATVSGSAARGLSVFHHETSIKGKALATSIFGQMHSRTPEMPQYNAGVLADEGDGVLNDESFLDHSLYVLKHSKSPAALVELGFVTSIPDRGLLDDGRFLDRAALGIADGLRAWFLGD